MIRSEHVREDLEKVKVKDEVTLKDVAHCVSLVAKLLLDIRQNQVAIMKNEGVKLSTVKKNTPTTEE